MEVNFKAGDIVWVKLGLFWFPSEIVYKTEIIEPGEVHLANQPVAVVKCFDRDQFIEIKSTNCIHPYNCRKKYDFIKKGMDAFRAHNPKLALFPKDVCVAEVKTGGNIDILSDPMFTPNDETELFKPLSSKKLKGKQKQLETKPLITHRRFLGYDDYEARVLVLPHEYNPELEKPENQPEKVTKFICPICCYATDTLTILMKHVKGLGHMTAPIMRKPKEKRKKKKIAMNGKLLTQEKKQKKVVRSRTPANGMQVLSKVQKH